MRKCEKCGCEDFEILARCADLSVCHCNIDDDGTIEYLSDNPEGVLSTTYANQARCDNCGHVNLVNPELTSAVISDVLAGAKEQYGCDDIDVGQDESDVEMVEDGFWVNARVWVATD